MSPVIRLSIAAFALVAVTASAHAECSGSNGRGWGTGNGKGSFEMTSADKVCKISFPGLIDEVKKTREPATDVTITRQPKNGKVSVVKGQGLIYTPARNFKGEDQFCTKNTTPKVKGKSLSGCITVMVK